MGRATGEDAAVSGRTVNGDLPRRWGLSRDLKEVRAGIVNLSAVPTTQPGTQGDSGLRVFEEKHRSQYCLCEVNAVMCTCQGYAGEGSGLGVALEDPVKTLAFVLSDQKTIEFF